MADTSARRRFRALHERGTLFVMPNPWDVGTARVLAALGFEALASASAAVAATVGKPDAVVDRETSLAHARLLVEASDLPVNGDLREGYGRAPDAVATTVRAAIAAGLAGCSIEDLADGELLDAGLAVERIEAAVAVRDALDPDFVLTARCEAFLTEDADPLTTSIDRLAAMAGAGADVVYPCGMHRPEDIRAFVGAVSAPLNILGGTGPAPLSTVALADLGVRRVSMGPRLLQAALAGFLNAAREIREDGTFTFMRDAASLAPFQGEG